MPHIFYKSAWHFCTKLFFYHYFLQNYTKILILPRLRELFTTQRYFIFQDLESPFRVTECAFQDTEWPFHDTERRFTPQTKRLACGWTLKIGRDSYQGHILHPLLLNIPFHGKTKAFQARVIFDDIFPFISYCLLMNCSAKIHFFEDKNKKRHASQETCLYIIMSPL